MTISAIHDIVIGLYTDDTMKIMGVEIQLGERVLPATTSVRLVNGQNQIGGGKHPSRTKNLLRITTVVVQNGVNHPSIMIEVAMLAEMGAGGLWTQTVMMTAARLRHQLEVLQPMVVLQQQVQRGIRGALGARDDHTVREIGEDAEVIDRQCRRVDINLYRP